MAPDFSRELIVLAIETSCDETAVAILRRAADGSGAVLADIVASQDEAHEPFGGIVPELAARAHVERLDGLIIQAVAVSGVALAKVDAIAATTGPGLIGGLIVGAITGTMLARALGKPFLGINHLEGHALTVGLTEGVRPPYLLLLVSGGHTQIIAVDGIGRYRRLATTLDDALGEAFDKTAMLLGLGFPGGRAVEALATAGDAARFAFPRPMLGRSEPHFSFSGLKTAVAQAARQHAPLTIEDCADIAAGFQAAVIESTADRVARAMATEGATRLVAAGGVMANAAMRAALAKLCSARGMTLHVPPPRLCTDNAAMIGWAAAERLANGIGAEPAEGLARPRWPLDPGAAAARGAGVKA